MVSRNKSCRSQSCRNYPRRITIKKEDRVFFLPTEQIAWIEAYDNYVRVHTDAEIYIQRGKLSAFEAALDPNEFFRASRSSLVNIKHISELRSMFKGAYSVILRNGARVSMARDLRKLERLINSDS